MKTLFFVLSLLTSVFSWGCIDQSPPEDKVRPDNRENFIAIESDSGNFKSGRLDCAGTNEHSGKGSAIRRYDGTPLADIPFEREKYAEWQAEDYKGQDEDGEEEGEPPKDEGEDNKDKKDQEGESKPSNGNGDEKD